MEAHLSLVAKAKDLSAEKLPSLSSTDRQKLLLEVMPAIEGDLPEPWQIAMWQQVAKEQASKLQANASAEEFVECCLAGLPLITETCSLLLFSVGGTGQSEVAQLKGVGVKRQILCHANRQNTLPRAFVSLGLGRHPGDVFAKSWCSGQV